MIIIEGPDNSGKSTLVRELAQRLQPCHVAHSSGPTRSVDEMFKKVRRFNHLYVNTKSLVDRWPVISESVYGPVLREESMIAGSRFLDDLQRSRVPIIYCRPPMNTLMSLENHQVRKEESSGHIEGVNRNQEKLVNAYDEFMVTMPNTIYYDWTTSDNNYLDFLAKYIKLYWSTMR